LDSSQNREEVIHMTRHDLFWYNLHYEVEQGHLGQPNHWMTRNTKNVGMVTSVIMNYWTPYKAFAWEQPSNVAKGQRTTRSKYIWWGANEGGTKTRDFVNYASDAGIAIGIISHMQ